MRKMILLSAAVLLSACNSAVREPAGAGPSAAAAPHDKQVTSEGPVQYQALRLGAFAARRPVGLCELGAVLNGGAGVYKVVSLTGATEDTAEGGHDGFTYVQLELVKAWTDGAPERPVARITGGPAGKGLTRGSPVALAVGETLGVLLSPPRDENRGFHGIDSLGLFQADPRGGYTNGQLFVGERRELAEIGRLVRENAGAAKDRCPHDVRPPAGPAAGPVQPKVDATEPVQIKLGEGTPGQ